MELPIHGVLMLGGSDAYVASHGRRALGVAIFNTDLPSDAIGLLDVSIREEAHAKDGGALLTFSRTSRPARTGAICI